MIEFQREEFNACIQERWFQDNKLFEIIYEIFMPWH